MSKLHATVSKIIKFSCVDGPGNRLVIFLQGCNFNCLNCHNPHTIGFCDTCGDCVDACPEQALSIVDVSAFRSEKDSAEDVEKNVKKGTESILNTNVKKSKGVQINWNERACIGCDLCVNHCDKSASPRTQSYSVDGLISVIRANLGFINGVTISGGEATLQAKFIASLFKTIKSTPELQHLSCFIDSNGSLSTTAWNKLLPVVDGVMLDLKAWSQQTHTWLTGHSSTKVLQSIELLADKGKLHELRLLHIPGKTDFEENIETLSSYINQLPDDVAIRLNAFRNHGVTGEASLWPNCTQEQLESLAKGLSRRGVDNIILPSVY